MIAIDADVLRAAITGDRFIALARDLGGKPRKLGTDWRCPCFLHGGNGPNLVLTPNKGLWHCFTSCGGGDAIALVMKARSLRYPEAVEWLAAWAGIKPGAERVPPAPCRPAWTPKPVATPSNDAATFLSRLWDVVHDAPWSETIERWLSETRCVEPDVVNALGCRDWSTCRPALAELFTRAPTSILEAAGFARDGRVHRAVLGCLHGEAEWSAVAVPIWRLDRPFPEGWRFRLVTPKATQDGNTIKSLCPFATGFPIDLLGTGRPGLAGKSRLRTTRLGSASDGGDLLVIVEGEPDWWSATEVVDGRAGVLAVCGSPARWREGWPDLADLAALGVRRVAVCVHRGDPKKGKEGQGHGEHFARAVAQGCARAGLDYTRKLPAEGADLNDLHRAGRLHDFLADVIEVSHGR